MSKARAIKPRKANTVTEKSNLDGGQNHSTQNYYLYIQKWPGGTTKAPHYCSYEHYIIIKQRPTLYYTNTNS